MYFVNIIHIMILLRTVMFAVVVVTVVFVIELRSTVLYCDCTFIK